VYRYNPATDTLTDVITDQNHKPNGLGFSPDEKFFYLNVNEFNQVRKYGVNDDGSLTDLGLIITKMSMWPDGMAVDTDGNLWIAIYAGTQKASTFIHLKGNG
jgi:sugar lactone lactonase YvrE